MTLGLLLTNESTAWAAAALETSTPSADGDGGEACTATAVPVVTSATANTPAAVANRGESFKGAFFQQRPPHRGMLTGCAGTNGDTRTSKRLEGRRARRSTGLPSTST